MVAQTPAITFWVLKTGQHNLAPHTPAMTPWLIKANNPASVLLNPMVPDPFQSPSRSRPDAAQPAKKLQSFIVIHFLLQNH